MISQAKQNGNPMVAVADKMVREPGPYSIKVGTEQGIIINLFYRRSIGQF
jgi:hypothetical protein